MAAASEQEFVPLRKKQKRVSTGAEDNFVSSYMPRNRSIQTPSQELLEKVVWAYIPLRPHHTPSRT